MALVANYGDSSSEEESEDDTTATGNAKVNSGVNLLTSTNTDSDDEDFDTDKLTSSQRVSLPTKSVESATDKLEPKLPLPSFMAHELSALSSVANPISTKSFPSSSVFANPFQKAEQQKLSILEQHVKLSSAEKTETEMGKKICWMYRKGRCRFGHKCKFAHDNDINLKQVSQEQASEVPPATGNHFQHGQFVAEGFGNQYTEDEDQSTGQSMKRKKPGLAQGLVPPKKSMMAFHKQAAHERPWTKKK